MERRRDPARRDGCTTNDRAASSPGLDGVLHRERDSVARGGRVGTCLVLKLHDARDDTGVSRLLRVIDALESWCSPHDYSVSLAAPWRSPTPGGERGLERAVGAAGGIRLDTIRDAAGARAALGLVSTPEKLAITASGPMGRLVISLSEQHFQCMLRATDAQLAMRARCAGDVEINLDKRGRRHFEQAGGDDEVERIELALGQPENALPHHTRKLRDALAARAAHVIDTRRIAMVELFEALARTFGPASMKAYLDADDYISPLATMAYYRDEAAVCDDLALLADATDSLSEPGRPGSYLGYALARSTTVRGAPVMDAESAAEATARLRAITPRDVRATADAMPSWVTVTAGGLFVTNPDWNPVGAPIAPFFERLLVSIEPCPPGAGAKSRAG
jgi:hypothetical protein